MKKQPITKEEFDVVFIDYMDSPIRKVLEAEGFREIESNLQEYIYDEFRKFRWIDRQILKVKVIYIWNKRRLEKWISKYTTKKY
jgi:hypothetical protein